MTVTEPQLADGRIVQSGDKDLALKLEEEGYAWIKARKREEQAAFSS